VTTAAPFDPSLFTPTVAQLEAVLVARGTFSATSTPSVGNVQQALTDEAASLAGELTVLPDSLVGKAVRVVIYKVAADIEAGTWPEQQMGAGASGGIWYARWVQEHQALLTLAGEYGDTPGTAKSVCAPSQTALAAAEWLKEDPTFAWLPDWVPEF
jgi:hypothetical protein